ncbi:MAG: complex I NDUFA9 subunit family protein [Pseudomonadota bacterium]
MKVALFGGTGFVGGYLVDALLDKGRSPVLLVRAGSEHKLRRAGDIDVVEGDLTDAGAIEAVLDGADAVIYNVGILREYPRAGITFERLQYRGAVRVIEAARRAGVSRLILMSANGVRRPGTPYQETKFRAEEFALRSGMDVTVFRPSVIFGDPRGSYEFATQLHREMIATPLPGIGFHNGWSAGKGQIHMSPVHVEDVARAFVEALDDPSTIGKTYALGGPEVLSWTEMLSRVAAATGRKKTILPMPISLMRVGATAFDWLPFFPVTRDQLTMLAEGNRVESQDLEALTRQQPAEFSNKTLSYLKQ